VCTSSLQLTFTKSPVDITEKTRNEYELKKLSKLYEWVTRAVCSILQPEDFPIPTFQLYVVEVQLLSSSCLASIWFTLLLPSHLFRYNLSVGKANWRSWLNKVNCHPKSVNLIEISLKRLFQRQWQRRQIDIRELDRSICDAARSIVGNVVHNLREKKKQEYRPMSHTEGNSAKQRRTTNSVHIMCNEAYS